MIKMTSEKKTELLEGFAALGLDAKLLSTLTALGYEEPTPIQRAAIGPMLAGSDLMGQAATGTGKTAAFALPMLQRISAAGKDRAQPSALVLVPTRELCMQVAEAVHKYGQKLKVAVAPIYGGASFSQQLRMLERGVDIVVATPGRALDHIRRKTLNLGGVSILVLDEADEMLDMGFAEDLEAILAQTPPERQTVLFSATLPARITGMAKRHLKAPVRIQIARETTAKGTAPRVRQTAYVVPRASKLPVLGRILDLEDPASALVFCRTRTEVDELTEKLSAHGYRAQAMHGGISQDQRTRVIKRLREGGIDLVIATDVAARGLDIENLSHVINYDVPTSADSYVHRIGRVGRAGREGVAITLADPRESRLLQHFERQTKGKIEIAKVPTVADLRKRRLELTRDALRKAAADDDLEQYRWAVDALTQEHDLMKIALAAVKLAHLAMCGEHEDTEIEIAIPKAPAAWNQGQSDKPVSRRSKRQAGPGSNMARIYIGAGREAGIRPQDLVGAIAGESGISGQVIGAIEIEERFSLVELPEKVVEDVLRAMRHALIKGKKVTLRRFVER
jgi:ATP-dependent RNA helicase DeaD